MRKDKKASAFMPRDGFPLRFFYAFPLFRSDYGTKPTAKFTAKPTKIDAIFYSEKNCHARYSNCARLLDDFN